MTAEQIRPPTLAEPRPRYDIVAVCVVLALSILALDLAAPMGIASGALYVTVIMFSLMADSAKITWKFAWAMTAMTLAGLIVSMFEHKHSYDTTTLIMLINRGVSLILIWMTASLGSRLLKVKRQVLEHGLELQRVNFELHKIARHDALTGVANRRYFDERLAEEFARAMRDKTPLSLLMIDVDFFKRFNDRNGHQAGDACLMRVAQAIQSNVRRPADIVARYGGEEFAVILPGTTAGGAQERAEVIRAYIEEMKIYKPGSKEVTSVTVSVGVASIRAGEPGITAAKLISAADGALYQVKQAGRNAVKLASETMVLVR